jgi:hypothetical protein
MGIGLHSVFPQNLNTSKYRYGIKTAAGSKYFAGSRPCHRSAIVLAPKLHLGAHMGAKFHFAIPVEHGTMSDEQTRNGNRISREITFPNGI